MLTMGEYPGMSLADARAARDKAKAQLKDGANPVHVSRAQRLAIAEQSENTFGVIADELLAKRAREGLGVGSVKRERRLIDQDLAGIKKTPIAEVSAPVLLAALRKLEARGTIETAHRARSFAGLVFKYANATGRTKSNPAADLVGACSSHRRSISPASRNQRVSATCYEQFMPIRPRP